MKRLLSMLFLSLFLISLSSATQVNLGVETGIQIFYPEYEYVKLDTPFDLHIHAANITDGKEMNNSLLNCTLHLYNKTGSHILQQELEKDPNWIDWYLYIDSGNYSQIGEHAFRIYCLDENSIGGTISGTFYVNYLGKAVPTGLDGRFILLIFFMGLIVMLAYYQSQIDFNRWYNKIISKYYKRNFFRTFMAKLGYYFMENPFSLYYMIGLFVVLLLLNITEAYVIESAYNVMIVLVGIYLFGMFLVALEVFGEIHYFFSRIAEDVKKMGWGMQGG